MPQPFTQGAISSEAERYGNLGAREGGANRPPSDALALDANENSLKIRASEFVLQETQNYQQSIINCTQELGNAENKAAEIDQNVLAIQGPQGLRPVFDNVIASNSDELRRAFIISINSRASLNYFRHRLNIEQPARYPDDKLLHFAWVLVFVTVETAINTFFMKGRVVYWGAQSLH